MATDGGQPPLPEGWRWLEDARTLRREVGGHAGWRIDVEFDSHAPWDGPTRLEIRPDYSGEGLPAIADTSGLTTGILRSIPLGDIRREYRDIRSALRTLAGAPAEAERVESDRDLAYIARQYAELVALGHRSPIVELSEVWAVGRKTMSARIQRARARGLLEGDRGRPADRLTTKAQRLIDGIPE